MSDHIEHACPRCGSYLCAEKCAPRMTQRRPVRVPTLAEVIQTLERAEARVGYGSDQDRINAIEGINAAIDALKTIDGALADAAHDFTKIRGQR